MVPPAHYKVSKRLPAFLLRHASGLCKPLGAKGKVAYFNNTVSVLIN
jgi:hypothetical protein